MIATALEQNTNRGRRGIAPQAASSGSDGESVNTPGGVDPESLARAREAAKNDDYEWFMEFIEGDSDRPEITNDAVGTARGAPGRAGGAADEQNAAFRENIEVKEDNPDGIESSRRERSRRRSPRRGSYSDLTNDDIFDGGGGAGEQGYRSSISSGNSRSSDRGRRFSSRSRRSQDASAATGRGRGVAGGGRRVSASTPADTAYDYDFDDEFEGERGRGGWDYDPGLTAGVAARRRDVDIGRVRSKAKVAAQRLPLEDDAEEEEKEAADGVEEMESAGGDADGVAASQIGAEKVNVISDGLF